MVTANLQLTSPNPFGRPGQVCVATPMGEKDFGVRLPDGLAPGTWLRTQGWDKEQRRWIVEELEHPERVWRVEIQLLEVVGFVWRRRGRVSHVVGEPYSRWWPTQPSGVQAPTIGAGR